MCEVHAALSEVTVKPYVSVCAAVMGRACVCGGNADNVRVVANAM